jgi:prepilin-type processing-associated H-X9-DG protein
MIARSKTSGLAIASLVLGILGLTCILPIIGALLAVIFGIVALNQIGKSGGQLTGHGQAVAGLITGGIGLLMLPIMAALLLPALGQARGKARSTLCINNVKQIGIACTLYANDNNDKPPRSFDDLKQELPSRKVLICPAAKDQTNCSYAFTGATNLWQADPNVIVLREIEANHRGRRTVLYADGHVEQRKD